MQVLSLAQQLEANTQTGHFSGIEAASVPVTSVSAATVTTAGTLAASGQTADTAGMSTPHSLRPVLLKCNVHKEENPLEVTCHILYIPVFLWVQLETQT